MRFHFLLNPILLFLGGLWLASLGFYLLCDSWQEDPGVPTHGKVLQAEKELGSVIKARSLLENRRHLWLAARQTGSDSWSKELRQARHRFDHLLRSLLREKDNPRVPIVKKAKGSLEELTRLEQDPGARKEEKARASVIATIDGHLKGLEAALMKEIEQRVATPRAEANQRSRLLRILLVSVTVLFGLGVFLVHRWVTSPLRRLKKSIHSLGKDNPRAVKAGGAMGEVKQLITLWNETVTGVQKQLKTASQANLSMKIRYRRLFDVMAEEGESAMKALKTRHRRGARTNGTGHEQDHRDLEMALGLLRDFAEMGRLASLPVLPEDEYADLNYIARRAVKNCTSHFARKSIHLDFHAPDPALSLDVHADFGLVEKAVMNLMVHVFKTARPGTSMKADLKVADDRKAELTLEYEACNDSLAESESLINRFRSGGAATGGTSRSSLVRTGLGLPLSCAIALQYGGWIRVKAGQGERLVLEFVLPISSTVQEPSAVLACARS